MEIGAMKIMGSEAGLLTVSTNIENGVTVKVYDLINNPKGDYAVVLWDDESEQVVTLSAFKNKEAAEAYATKCLGV
jgi:hypothetical protein